MARLPYVELENAPEKTRSALEALPDIGIFRMVAHAETALRPFLRLGGSILGQQKLSDRLRELAILRVANLSRARYEWVQHVPFARRAGITDAQIEAIEQGEIEGDLFDSEDRAVLRFTTEALEKVRVSDQTFAEVASRLTPREVVELLLAIGFYRMVATLLETTAVDLDLPPGDEFVSSATSETRPRR